MTTIPPHGLSKQEVLDRLAEFRRDDKDWRGGRVLGYNYDPGAAAAEVAEAAFLNYLGDNSLDPTTFPSMKRLECEVVRMLAHLLRGDEHVVGNFTSGGTESILLAVKTARDRARALRPEIDKPEMVLPLTAHCAFHKAARYFDVKPVVTPFDVRTFRADVDAMRAAINENTILLVASAPGYAQGVIDPIAEIGQMAEGHGLLLHVDACVGGIQLSFMRRMGAFDLPDFDFSVPGVTSISVDMHKYGYSPKGASTVLYRNKDIRRYQIFASTDSTSYALVNNVIQSSRSGGPLAAAWATLNFLGEEGYRQMIRDVVAATNRLIEGINATGDLKVLGQPQISMFSFASETINIFELADEMSLRGWYVQPQFSTELSPPNLHVSVTRGTVGKEEEFLSALRDSLAAVKANPAPIRRDVVRQQVQSLLQFAGQSDATPLAELAGLSGTALPERMALLNTVLDSLPKPMANAILVEFFNDWYV